MFEANRLGEKNKEGIQGSPTDVNLRNEREEEG